MTIQVILSLIIFLVVLVITQPKIKEAFNTYDICVDQGYPVEWCFKAATPNNAAGPCVCPPGQKLYRRYGTCYCQSYAS
tara:strand:- start:1334 stop:1570 length:237 start_codon:yes stop_codon:yes gene_type:complete